VLDQDARFLADPMTDLILAGVGDVARERGFSLVIQAARPGDIDLGLLTPLVDHRVDGAMLLLSGAPDLRHRYRRRVAALGYPFVVFEDAATEATYAVTAANHDAAHALTTHLIHRGHERIAFVAAAVPWPMIEERHAGYLRAHRDAGLDAPADLQVFNGAWDPRSGEALASVVLDRREPATAIMAGNDLLAIGVMHAARARGLRIPAGVAVTGFNDFDFAAFVDPPLSTASIPAYDMGAAAATMLIDHLQGAPARSRQFPVQVVLRESS
jgi:DNA-binding LacI/PurR family transcriptional regulator